MQSVFKNRRPNTLILKLISLSLGYLAWSMMSQSQLITRDHTVPLYFYNIPKNTQIKAPETVTVQLRGTKKLLSKLCTPSLAAHIDTQTFKQGVNILALSSTSLFLPQQVELLYTIPCPIMVSLEPSY